jgi:xylulokinase
MSLLGIDVGTSGCKAAVFSEEGTVLSLAYTEYDVQRPQPGWAELDALSAWQAIKSTITQAAAQAGRRDPIQALSISSLGEAMVPVTLDRRILGPSLLNFDRRGETFLPGLLASLRPEILFSINGNTPGNQYGLTKLMWIKANQPDLYARTDRFLHWSSFVGFMLGADPAVDYSLANRSLLFDLEQKTWSPLLLSVTGLDADKLPVTVPSGTPVGKVDEQVAAELGLLAGTLIVSGAHDQCANAIGCGVIRDGQAVYGMGTYHCITPVYSRRLNLDAMAANGLNTEHHAVPGKYVSFLYNQGGALIKWYRDTFAHLEHQQAQAGGQDIYSALIAETSEEPSGIFVLPHFTATGPPEFIDDSCGVILGLHLETRRGAILKGLMECATFYLKELVDRLPLTGIDIQEYRVSGGGSKSDAWIQTCADILGQPFTRPKVTEAGCLGAALMAGVGAGRFSSFDEGVTAMIDLDRTFDPNLTRVQQYQDQFKEYIKLWPLLRSFIRK